ncbi:MAG: hypothetical protein H6739_14600 [Alphaproteobacteria bacterium]|nr:hypothetical protein [Alphaproteobacteria bacterium]
MPLPDQVPVVVGAGLAGLLTSVCLSKAGVRHALLGPPTPPDALRLGESVDAVGSLELAALLPELAEHLIRKDNVALHAAGGQCSVLDFIALLSAPRVRSSAHGLFGLPRSTPWLFHLQRYGFDPALFERCVADPLVSHGPQRVTEVEAEGDRVAALHLEDGAVVCPSHVFDATNHVRLLGKAFGVPPQLLGGPKVTVFTRYLRDDDGCDHLTGPNWLRTSHLMALTEARHGFNGLVWCLPMPGFVSVGVSLEADAARPDDATVLDVAARAGVDRGVDWRGRYPIPGPVQALRHQYFFHERPWGGNWMMVGGSAFTMHLGASSGVSIALATARVAPGFLRRPQAVGRRLEGYVRRAIAAQETYDLLQYSEQVDQAAVERWVHEGIQRVTNHAALCGTPAHRLAGNLGWWMLQRRLLTWPGFGCPDALFTLPAGEASIGWMNAREGTALPVTERPPLALGESAG